VRTHDQIAGWLFDNARCSNEIDDARGNRTLTRWRRTLEISFQVRKGLKAVSAGSPCGPIRMLDGKV
jgi:hypothetical protein